MNSPFNCNQININYSFSFNNDNSINQGTKTPCKNSFASDGNVSYDKECLEKKSLIINDKEEKNIYMYNNMYTNMYNDLHSNNNEDNSCNHLSYNINKINQNDHTNMNNILYNDKNIVASKANIYTMCDLKNQQEEVKNKNESIIYKNEEMINKNESIIYKNEKMINKNECIIYENEKMINKNESIIYKNDMMIKQNDMVINKNERMINQNDMIINQNNIMINQNEKMINQKGMIINQNDNMSRGEIYTYNKNDMLKKVPSQNYVTIKSASNHNFQSIEHIHNKNIDNIMINEKNPKEYHNKYNQYNIHCDNNDHMNNIDYTYYNNNITNNNSNVNLNKSKEELNNNISSCHVNKKNINQKCTYEDNMYNNNNNNNNISSNNILVHKMVTNNPPKISAQTYSNINELENNKVLYHSKENREKIKNHNIIDMNSNRNNSNNGNNHNNHYHNNNNPCNNTSDNTTLLMNHQIKNTNQTCTQIEELKKNAEKNNNIIYNNIINNNIINNNIVLDSILNNNMMNNNIINKSFMNAPNNDIHKNMVDKIINQCLLNSTKKTYNANKKDNMVNILHTYKAKNNDDKKLYTDINNVNMNNMVNNYNMNDQSVHYMKQKELNVKEKNQENYSHVINDTNNINYNNKINDYNNITPKGQVDNKDTYNLNTRSNNCYTRNCVDCNKLINNHIDVSNGDNISPHNVMYNSMTNLSSDKKLSLNNMEHLQEVNNNKDNSIYYNNYGNYKEGNIANIKHVENVANVKHIENIANVKHIQNIANIKSVNSLNGHNIFVGDSINRHQNNNIQNNTYNECKILDTNLCEDNKIYKEKEYSFYKKNYETKEDMQNYKNKIIKNNIKSEDISPQFNNMCNLNYTPQNYDELVVYPKDDKNQLVQNIKSVYEQNNNHNIHMENNTDEKMFNKNVHHINEDRGETYYHCEYNISTDIPTHNYMNNLLINNYNDEKSNNSEENYTSNNEIYNSSAYKKVNMDVNNMDSRNHCGDDFYSNQKVYGIQKEEERIIPHKYNKDIYQNCMINGDEYKNDQVINNSDIMHINNNNSNNNNIDVSVYSNMSTDCKSNNYSYTNLNNTEKDNKTITYGNYCTAIFDPDDNNKEIYYENTNSIYDYSNNVNYKLANENHIQNIENERIVQTKYDHNNSNKMNTFYNDHHHPMHDTFCHTNNETNYNKNIIIKDIYSTSQNTEKPFLKEQQFDHTCVDSNNFCHPNDSSSYSILNNICIEKNMKKNKTQEIYYNNDKIHNIEERGNINNFNEEFLFLKLWLSSFNMGKSIHCKKLIYISGDKRYIRKRNNKNKTYPFNYNEPFYFIYKPNKDMAVDHNNNNINNNNNNNNNINNNNNNNNINNNNNNNINNVRLNNINGHIQNSELKNNYDFVKYSPNLKDYDHSNIKHSEDSQNMTHISECIEYKNDNNCSNDSITNNNYHTVNNNMNVYKNIIYEDIEEPHYNTIVEENENINDINMNYNRYNNIQNICNNNENREIHINNSEDKKEGNISNISSTLNKDSFCSFTTVSSTPEYEINKNLNQLESYINDLYTNRKIENDNNMVPKLSNNLFNNNITNSSKNDNQNLEGNKKNMRAKNGMDTFTKMTLTNESNKNIRNNKKDNIGEQMISPFIKNDIIGHKQYYIDNENYNNLHMCNNKESLKVGPIMNNKNDLIDTNIYNNNNNNNNNNIDQLCSNNNFVSSCSLNNMNDNTSCCVNDNTSCCVNDNTSCCVNDNTSCCVNDNASYCMNDNSSYYMNDNKEEKNMENNANTINPVVNNIRDNVVTDITNNNDKTINNFHNNNIYKEENLDNNNINIDPLCYDEELFDDDKNIPKITGVSYDRKQKIWVSHWRANCKTVHKYFSVKKYGFEEARKLAIKCREENVNYITTASILNNNFTKHAYPLINNILKNNNMNTYDLINFNSSDKLNEQNHYNNNYDLYEPPKKKKEKIDQVRKNNNQEKKKKKRKINHDINDNMNYYLNDTNYNDSQLSQHIYHTNHTFNDTYHNDKYISTIIDKQKRENISSNTYKDKYENLQPYEKHQDYKNCKEKINYQYVLPNNYTNNFSEKNIQDIYLNTQHNYINTKQDLMIQYDQENNNEGSPLLPPQKKKKKQNPQMLQINKNAKNKIQDFTKIKNNQTDKQIYTELLNPQLNNSTNYINTLNNSSINSNNYMNNNYNHMSNKKDQQSEMKDIIYYTKEKFNNNNYNNKNDEYKKSDLKNYQNIVNDNTVYNAYINNKQMCNNNNNNNINYNNDNNNINYNNDNNYINNNNNYYYINNNNNNNYNHSIQGQNNNSITKNVNNSNNTCNEINHVYNNILNNCSYNNFHEKENKIMQSNEDIHNNNNITTNHNYQFEKDNKNFIVPIQNNQHFTNTESPIKNVHLNENYQYVNNNHPTKNYQKESQIFGNSNFHMNH
ncbi:transcription factor with AP2 domain(s) [Plasmodium sp. gorilla clade G2]|uniref:transcription factor with AP2 domain(s) n=1 Tax=Plasmodium sp. gorilla clade G2 TaxID=880535 RepID=UPI000D223339|nr:transcription factor with AP2 domain(s) [Plasmodium sp. gorilla clade G2]SOV16872.1 transcription factor with AP2 domain(s) [Plasmodium sp. gorilla clade G2]